MKKLLCPVDFSSDSLNALEFAARIAEQQNASLTLIHVFTEHEFGEALSKGLLSNHYKQSDIDNLVGAAEDLLSKLADEVNKISKARGLQFCDYHFTYGPLERQLVEYAEEHAYDLIIMGTTGVTDVMERYIGSNTVRAISRAHCPVLCIPENAQYHKINKVVYATDYQMEDNIVLNQLSAFVQPMQAEIHIVHVSQQDNEMEEAMYTDYVEQTRTYLNYDKLKFAVEFNEDPAHGIDAYVIREKADLVAVLYQRKNFIERLLDESTTKDIAYFATYPVLIFKEEEEPVQDTEE
jgi:nucleotide-binding universal stress UspA family protein